MDIKRGSGSTVFPCQSYTYGGQKKDVELKDICALFNVDSIIRIWHEDFESIPSKGTYVHFNFETCGHIVGKKYALLPIVESGFYDEKTKEEKMPVLNLDHVRIGECVKVEQKQKYDLIDTKIFEYAFARIKNISSLQAFILDRYGQSLPQLSKEEILSRGVSITRVEIKKEIM